MAFGTRVPGLKELKLEAINAAAPDGQNTGRNTVHGRMIGQVS